jgi:hypothetical protein
VLTNWQLNRVAWPCIEQRVRFYFAGFCADRRFACSLASRENSAADFAQALRLIDDEARWARLLTQTDIVIASHWSAVQVVAAALLEREILTAMELYEIILRSR